MSKMAQPNSNIVDSLLDTMVDGREYESIVSKMPRSGEILTELRRAINDIEVIRGRPLICYTANVVKGSDISINQSDDLPFSEMVAAVPTEKSAVDVLVVTPGGSGQQVSQFVNCLRKRFSEVDFILPYMCMSAGTLLAMSGDKIWMDSRAYIGPIDPQVRLPDGRFVPAQSLLILLDKLKLEGQQLLAKGQPIPWHYVRMIDNLDPKQVGDAITQSEYSIKLATGFLKTHKFKTWTTHSNGQPVTDSEREARAKDIASLFCSHDYWKSHAHGITRDVVQNELRIKIENLEDVTGLERAVRRLWALLYWTFDKGVVQKVFVSAYYCISRNKSPGPK